MGTGKKQTAFLGLRVLGDQNLPTLFLLLDHPFAEVWAPGKSCLHTVDLGISGPAATGLSLPPEKNAEQTPQDDQ